YGSVPDCGSVCEMIYNATKKRPYVIGKPQAAMPLIAMDMTGHKKQETAVIGDRIYTDVKSGINAGALSILVMSGETTKEMLNKSDDKPDIVINSAKEILEILKKV
ncbi:MAG: HAD hydrolase-like protein, partial [Clostridia bacterium]|nr:HAD hydrolase-like protein [Clostridia bacterium]